MARPRDDLATDPDRTARRVARARELSGGTSRMVAKTRTMVAIGSVSKSPHTFAAVETSEFEWCARSQSQPPRGLRNFSSKPLAQYVTRAGNLLCSHCKTTRTAT